MELYQNYPNPFTSSTNISFSCSRITGVEIQVLDLLGKPVRTLTAGQFSPSHHTLTWDATSETGNKVASGIYYYRVASGNTTHVKKMIFIQ